MTWQGGIVWNTASGTTSWSYGFSPAADDTYTVTSRATDKATNVESPSGSHTFTIDDTPPTSSASSPGYATSPSFSVSYLAADPGVNPSGLDTVEIFVKVPGAGSYVSAHLFSSAAASGSFTYTAVDGDGNYAFYSVATDKAGNLEVSPLSPDTTTLLDTQAPTSSASSPAYSTSTSFSVSYTASDPIKSGSVGPASGLDTVEIFVKVPGAGNYVSAHLFSSAAASGSFTYTAVDGDGNYAFYSVATDKAGNVEVSPLSPDTTTLLDTQQPNSQITFPVDGGNYNSATFTGGCGTVAGDICGTAADPLKNGSASGVALVEISIKQASSTKYWDGIGFNNLTETFVAAATSDGWAHWSYYFGTPAEGQYTSIRGRPMPRATSRHRSTRRPSTRSISTSTTRRQARWSASRPTGPPDLDGLQRRLRRGHLGRLRQRDRPGHVTLGSRQGRGRDQAGQRPILERRDLAGGIVWNTASGTTSWSYGFSPAADDTYTVTSRATDKATNVESPSGSHTFTIDDTPPTSSASSPGYATSPSFSVSYLAADPGVNPSGLDTVEIFVKVPGAGKLRLGPPLQLGRGQRRFTYTAVDGDGNYAFYSVATDKAGNVEVSPLSPDTTTLLDTQAPTSSASSPAYSTSTSFSVSYTASDPIQSGSVGPASGLDTVEIFVKVPGAGSYVSAHLFSSAAASGSFTYTAVDGDGNYAFYSVATDKAGNVEVSPLSPDTTTLLDTQPNPDHIPDRWRQLQQRDLHGRLRHGGRCHLRRGR